jgi:hypothetical protein
VTRDPEWEGYKRMVYETRHSRWFPDTFPFTRENRKESPCLPRSFQNLKYTTILARGQIVPNKRECADAVINSFKGISFICHVVALYIEIWQGKHQGYQE